MISRITIKFISIILPVRIRIFLKNIIMQSLGYGYDLGSNNAEFHRIKKIFNNEIKVAIDIGGNYGNYTDTILKYFPQAQILIIEPQINLFFFLKKKYQNQKKIKILNIATHNKLGRLKIYKSFDGDGNASLYKRSIIKRNYINENVKTSTLDKLLKNNNVIDLIKIDVEGNEMNTLKGAKKILKKVKILQVEFGGTWIDSRNFYKDFYDFSKNNNFLIFRMTPEGLIKIKKYSETDEYFSFTNYLMINKKYKSEFHYKYM